MIGTPFRFVAICFLTAARLTALEIIINPSTELAANTDALAAFDRAAQRWESLLSDPIVVTINAGLTTYDNPNVLGSASSVKLFADYDFVRSALLSAGGSSTFPTNAELTFDLPTTFAGGGSTNYGLVTGPSGQIRIGANKANLKAIGFTGLDETFGAVDASINFNSEFSFDYDSSDGVEANQIDFESVAAHELGHALGFVSAVDSVDAALNANATNVLFNPYLMDLLRFADSDLPSNNDQFATNQRSLVPGEAASLVLPETFESYSVSTGQLTGDGRQASHWQDDALGGTLIGLMDPTTFFGESVTISEEDLKVFTALGYEAVPEPSGVLLLSFSVLTVGLGRRRR